MREVTSVCQADIPTAPPGPSGCSTRYNGRRYGHLLHPRRGYPADTALSMTVLAPTAMRADALATAALVMGLDGMAWLRGQPGVEALMVTHSPSRPDRVLVHASRGLRGRLTLFDGTAFVEFDS